MLLMCFLVSCTQTEPNIEMVSDSAVLLQSTFNDRNMENNRLSEINFAGENICGVRRHDDNRSHKFGIFFFYF